MVAAVTDAGKISAWVGSLGQDGKWPDNEVNYASGCDAQRANWPAFVHWARIVTMSAAYHGGINASTDAQWRNSSTLQTAISSAMTWWFDRDYTNDACLDGNGDAPCPCGTPGLWNTNWYSNVILIPSLVTQSCLLMNSTLTEKQSESCTKIPTRAYSPFYRAVVPGFVSAANILDMSRIGIDLSLRTENVTLLNEAYGSIHDQMAIEPDIAINTDGIKPDGSFGQHLGLNYAGNYGKDFVNAVMNLEEAALGTSFESSQKNRDAFSTLIDGDRWSIFQNTVTGVKHWDFSALSRFITFAVADGQASAGMLLNLTQINHVGRQWGSEAMIEFSESLSPQADTANAGDISGNRMFYSNDYMVHRGPGYVSTLKTFSKRTRNTEFTNNQNPYGFHLSDGCLYTYINGNEYEDISAVWDWNLIPGITTDYGNTVLESNATKYKGIQDLVGGASTGEVGVTAFRYKNPKTKDFQFDKAYFFLDNDVQVVMVANIRSNSSAPVFSVLDQKRRNGPIFLNGKAAKANATNPVTSLWHDSVGYEFEPASSGSVFFNTGNKTGNWSNIGTSTQGLTSANLFSAWIEHTNTSAPVAYKTFPATTVGEFKAKRQWTGAKIVRNDNAVTAVFWASGGGRVETTGAWYEKGDVAITASANSVVILREGQLTVADPTQLLTQLVVTVELSDNLRPASWGGAPNKTFTFDLPAGPGGAAGSSLTQSIW